jgi:PBP1b-binding outer membrane lipoprotein LpoB
MRTAGAQAGASHRVWLVVPILVVLLGCTGRTKRVDPDALSDNEVGTGLTSQDFRSVCQRMARSLMNVAEIQNAAEPPMVAIAPVANDSNDYIDGTEFARKMRTELIKHAEGRVRFLDRELTRRIDDENRDKRRGKITGGEHTTRHGADFFLTGRISAIDRVVGGGSSTYYRLSFRLTNAADSVIVWEDDYEIKKQSIVADIYR